MRTLVLVTLLAALAVSPVVAAHIATSSEQGCDDFDSTRSTAKAQLAHVHKYCTAINTDPVASFLLP